MVKYKCFYLEKLKNQHDKDYTYVSESLRTVPNDTYRDLNLALKSIILKKMINVSGYTRDTSVTG